MDALDPDIADEALHPLLRTITVEIRESNYIVLREGDRSTGGLCWDEALGSLAELTHPRIGECRYRMSTAEERIALALRRAANRGAVIDPDMPF